MYPEALVKPMKAEMTQSGFQELLSPEAVDQVLSAKEGTVLVFMNSVCGCAAGTARPGVRASLVNASKRPSTLATVFAGFDTEAVARTRQYLEPYPPSSPCIALFKDGKLVHFIERHHIEGRSAEMIAENLKMAYEQFC